MWKVALTQERYRCHPKRALRLFASILEENPVAVNPNQLHQDWEKNHSKTRHSLLSQHLRDESRAEAALSTTFGSNEVIWSAKERLFWQGCEETRAVTTAGAGLWTHFTKRGCLECKWNINASPPRRWRVTWGRCVCVWSAKAGLKSSNRPSCWLWHKRDKLSWRSGCGTWLTLLNRESCG